MKKILSNLKVILEMKHLIYLQKEEKEQLKILSGIFRKN